MPKQDFSSTEVAKLAGIPYQTLDFWVREKVVAPDVPAEGIGSRRRWMKRDVVFVILARTLKDQGVPMHSIRALVSSVRMGWTDDDPENAGVLIVRSWNPGTLAVHCRLDDQFAARVDMMMKSKVTPDKSTGLLFIVNVAHFARETYAQLDALRGKAGK